MIFFLSALLFSLSSNLDNLVIGMAYGIKKIKIYFFNNLVIAGITTTGTFLSMFLGLFISKFLSNSIANKLGSMIIVLLGVYFVIQSIRKLVSDVNLKDLALKDIKDMVQYAEKSDTDKSGDISAKESILVALGLTFNNLGTGIAASITGISVPLTTVLTFILSIVTIMFGQALGSSIIGKLFGKYAPLVSGMLLIALGIIEFIN
ncbi:manganese efflux pump [Clostridium folliculivorans]|uniref:Sporulation protein n=1 Tax=Clostridium folliculivorans TaxID=2886038 RepID=A0A9W6DAD9_9CLOT|nr:manganese efflux pump [Clostridium folliculivorans]GKU25275.1 sporulation protein [Clostridium folliculivorans]GKU28296.1 sporulation protein [Clostridium folliculivorans]